MSLATWWRRVTGYNDVFSPFSTQLCCIPWWCDVCLCVCVCVYVCHRQCHYLTNYPHYHSLNYHVALINSNRFWSTPSYRAKTLCHHRHLATLFDSRDLFSLIFVALHKDSFPTATNLSLIKLKRVRERKSYLPNKIDTWTRTDPFQPLI